MHRRNLVKKEETKKLKPLKVSDIPKKESVEKIKIKRPSRISVNSHSHC